MKKHIAIAGAGFSGAVLARELAESQQFRVSLYEEKKQVAGLCYTQRDEETGILVHEFGPRIFHTNEHGIWEYITRWGRFEPFTPQIKASTEKGIFPYPINLLALNQFFNKKLTPSEAGDFLGSLTANSKNTDNNLEQELISTIGSELYENFYSGLIKKRWGVDPSKLPVKLLEERPVRLSYEEKYYDDCYQGIPVSGYTEIIRRILDHQDITIRLGQRLEPRMRDQFDHIFWSGPMDGFFHYQKGRLGYRTFEYERMITNGDHMGCPIMNLCDEKKPITRLIEYKHFTPWETHDKTVCFKEYVHPAEEGDTPFLPMRLSQDLMMLKNYVSLAEKEKKVTFIGRLGTYRNLTIAETIQESLELANFCLKADLDAWPKFSQDPL